MKRKRILFVDDEPAVLDGIQNLLRKDRKRWDIVVAVGGQHALRELEAGPFDIVISDMRMPGLDGAELLAKVRAMQPDAARLILSGHAEPAAMMKALSVAQQFLSKPCDAATLRGAIERVCELQDSRTRS